MSKLLAAGWVTLAWLYLALWRGGIRITAPKPRLNRAYRRSYALLVPVGRVLVGVRLQVAIAPRAAWEGVAYAR